MTDLIFIGIICSVEVLVLWFILNKRVDRVADDVEARYARLSEFEKNEAIERFKIDVKNAAKMAIREEIDRALQETLQHRYGAGKTSKYRSLDD